MNGRDAKIRRMMALHNAELKGRQAAKDGRDVRDHPYVLKRIRGATVKLFEAWIRGWEEYHKEQQQGNSTHPATRNQ
jgi:hypothetical protein